MGDYHNIILIFILGSGLSNFMQGGTQVDAWGGGVQPPLL